MRDASSMSSTANDTVHCCCCTMQQTMTLMPCAVACLRPADWTIQQGFAVMLPQCCSHVPEYWLSCCSAYKNKGVQTLLDGVTDYLPSPLDVTNTALDVNKDQAPLSLASTAQVSMHNKHAPCLMTRCQALYASPTCIAAAHAESLQQLLDTALACKLRSCRKCLLAELFSV